MCIRLTATFGPFDRTHLATYPLRPNRDIGRLCHIPSLRDRKLRPRCTACTRLLAPSFRSAASFQEQLHRAKAAAVDFAYAVAAQPRSDAAGLDIPCARRSRIAENCPWSRHISASRAVFARMDAAAITLTLASPSTIARTGNASSGQCGPSNSTSWGETGSDSTARRMASRLACRMFRLSISSTVAQATAQASALFLMRIERRSRSRGPQDLGVGDAAGARRPGSNTTAAAQTGLRAAAAASSTPQIRRTAATAGALP